MRRRIHEWCVREAGDALLPVPRSRVVRLFSGNDRGLRACSNVRREKRWGLLDTADWHSSASLRSCRTILASKKHLLRRLPLLDTRWRATLLGRAKTLTGEPQASTLAAFGMPWASPLRSVI